MVQEVPQGIGELRRETNLASDSPHGPSEDVFSPHVARARREKVMQRTSNNEGPDVRSLVRLRGGSEAAGIITKESDMHHLLDCLDTRRESVKSFRFCGVYGTDAINEDVFRDDEISRLVRRFCGGNNVAIVTEGPTKSGKTHTLLGGHGKGDGLVDHIIARVIQTGVPRNRSLFIRMVRFLEDLSLPSAADAHHPDQKTHSFEHRTLGVLACLPKTRVALSKSDHERIRCTFQSRLNHHSPATSKAVSMFLLTLELDDEIEDAQAPADTSTVFAFIDRSGFGEPATETTSITVSTSYCHVETVSAESLVIFRLPDLPVQAPCRCLELPLENLQKPAVWLLNRLLQNCPDTAVLLFYHLRDTDASHSQTYKLLSKHEDYRTRNPYRRRGSPRRTNRQIS